MYKIDLSKKNAIVTGASRGIGEAIAYRLAENGAGVAVLSRHEDELLPVEERITGLGAKSLAVECDVSSQREIRDAFKRIYEELGSIDILVNNAGINSRKRLEALSEEEWDDEIDINLKGAFLCSKEASKYMRRNGSGWIVNISSIKGREASSSVSYGASKAGLIGLTRSLAKQLIPYNIYVNGVAPGFIDCGMSKLLSKEELEKYLKMIPLSRVGRPEEIADAVLFLVSDLSSYIVGCTLDVNGGYIMT